MVVRSRITRKTSRGVIFLATLSIPSAAFMFWTLPWGELISAVASGSWRTAGEADGVPYALQLIFAISVLIVGVIVLGQEARSFSLPLGSQF